MNDGMQHKRNALSACSARAGTRFPSQQQPDHPASPSSDSRHSFHNVGSKELFVLSCRHVILSSAQNRHTVYLQNNIYIWEHCHLSVVYFFFPLFLYFRRSVINNSELHTEGTYNAQPFTYTRVEGQLTISRKITDAIICASLHICEFKHRYQHKTRRCFKEFSHHHADILHSVAHRMLIGHLISTCS